jgi:hypothetical protein
VLYLYNSKEGTMKRISRSWALMKASAKILRRNKRLMFFPVISLIVLLAELAVIGSAGFGTLLLTKGSMTAEQLGQLFNAQHPDPMLSWALFGFLLVTYFVINFTMIYLNCAMVGCVLTSLEGGNPSIRGGLAMANSHIKQIFLWSLLTGIVSTLIDQICRYIPGFGGKILAFLGGTAWSIATFLVVPILVFEKNGAIGSVKRSAYLLRKTWGEQIVTMVGTGLFFGVFLIIGLVAFQLLAGAMVYCGTRTDTTVVMAIITGGGGFVVYLIALAIVFSCFAMILRAALYSYAATGMLPEEISPDLLPPVKV